MDVSSKSKIFLYTNRLLRVKPRSSHELREALKKKFFSDKEIQALIINLERKGLINDSKLARLWIKDRVFNHPRSKKLIISELLAKGVPESIIDDVFQREFPDYNDSSILRRIADEYLLKKGKSSDTLQKRRLYALLNRRGFEEEEIMDYFEHHEDK